MKKIRNGSFETNSSSTHTLGVGPLAETLESLSPDENGVLKIDAYDYVHMKEVASNIHEKVSYAACAGSGVSEELLTEALKLHTGAKEVSIYHDPKNFYDDGKVWAFRDGLHRINTPEELILVLVNPNATIYYDYN